MSNNVNFSSKDRKQSSLVAPSTVAGIHLSGPNANKTALVQLRGVLGRAGDLRSASLVLAKVYEKIGAFGSLFSDERLVEVLIHGGPWQEVFIDCPLTVPPCVACTLPSCPGIIHCDDVAVAYMLGMSEKVRRRGARKARPVNPQSQRVWDVMQLDAASERHEPSYSANLAPLVARARTLQRRLNSLARPVPLRETQIGPALGILHQALDLPADVATTYRRFEDGARVRQAIVTAMQTKGWLAMTQDEDLIAPVLASVEVFHAFIAACVAALHVAGLTRDRPPEFREADGWVLLPMQPPLGPSQK